MTSQKTSNKVGVCTSSDLAAKLPLSHNLSMHYKAFSLEKKFLDLNIVCKINTSGRCSEKHTVKKFLKLKNLKDKEHRL